MRFEFYTSYLKQYKYHGDEEYSLQLFIDCVSPFAYKLKLCCSSEAVRFLFNAPDLDDLHKGKIPYTEDLNSLKSLLDNEYTKQRVKKMKTVTVVICLNKKEVNPRHAQAVEKIKTSGSAVKTALEQFCLENALKVTAKSKKYILQKFTSSKQFVTLRHNDKGMFYELQDNYDVKQNEYTDDPLNGIFSTANILTNIRAGKQFKRALEECRETGVKKMKQMLEKSNYSPGENDPIFMTDNNIFCHILSYCTLPQLLKISTCSNYLRYFIKENIDTIDVQVDLRVSLAVGPKGCSVALDSEPLIDAKIYTFFKYYKDPKYIQLMCSYLSNREQHANNFTVLRHFFKSLIATHCTTVDLCSHSRAKAYHLFNRQQINKLDENIAYRVILSAYRIDEVSKFFSDPQSNTTSVFPTNTVIIKDYPNGIYNVVNYNFKALNTYFYCYLPSYDEDPEVVWNSMQEHKVPEQMCIVMDMIDKIYIKKGDLSFSIRRRWLKNFCRDDFMLTTHRKLSNYDVSALSEEQIALSRDVFFHLWQFPKPSASFSFK